MGQTQEWHKVHCWFQRARHKNGPGFIMVPKSQTQEWLCSQWARHTNDPSSFWFQRARHKNGPGFILVPKSQTQEWLCFQWARHRNDPGSRWFQRARRRNGSRTYIYIYMYIYSCLQAAHAGAHGQQRQVRFQYPTPGSSLATPWWRVEWPPAYTKFYIYSDGPHTHAPPQQGRWDDDENEVKMKMRWKIT